MDLTLSVSCRINALKVYTQSFLSCLKGVGMTKLELVAKIAENGNLSKRQAEETLAMMFKTIQEILLAGEQVAIPGRHFNACHCFFSIDHTGNAFLL